MVDAWLYRRGMFRRFSIRRIGCVMCRRLHFGIGGVVFSGGLISVGLVDEGCTGCGLCVVYCGWDRRVWKFVEKN